MSIPPSNWGHPINARDYICRRPDGSAAMARKGIADLKWSARIAPVILAMNAVSIWTHLAFLAWLAGLSTGLTAFLACDGLALYLAFRSAPAAQREKQNNQIGGA